MSQQPMNLRRVTRIAMRHKRLVGSLTILGIAAGAGYALMRPPTLTSTAVVVLNQPQASAGTPVTSSNGLDISMQTDILIAESQTVFSDALSRVGSGLTLQELTDQVSVGQAAPGALSFTATAATATNAEREVNAVADSFVSYIGSANSPIGKVQAHVLTSATSATSPDRVLRAIIAALIGAVVGLIAGLVGALRLDRRDPRLRDRDEIANSIGVPVIAALPAEAPSDAGGWIQLFEEYEAPDALHAWRMRATLSRLGVLADGMANRGAYSLCVISLASDGDALALGPQIAAFTAGLGVRTAFTIDAQHEAAQSAALRTACATPHMPVRGGNLLLAADAQVATNRHGLVSGAQLTVITTVVDLSRDQLPDVVRTSAAVLGVTAGGASGEQLARAAAVAADSGTLLAGVIVVNPDPKDKTTGLVPRPARPSRRALPTKHENAREVRIGDRTRPTDRVVDGRR